MANTTRVLLLAALTIATISLAGGASPHPVWAAGMTHTWTGLDPTNNRSWEKARNWSSMAVPQAGDLVEIEDAAVENVPDGKIFLKVTLKKGASLISGGPLATKDLDLQCSTLGISVSTSGTATFIGGELRPTAAGATADFVNSGTAIVRARTILDDGCQDTSIDPTVLKIFRGASFTNAGLLRGDKGRILGMACCASPQVLDNRRTGRIDATDQLTLESLRLRQNGGISGGLLLLDGGDHILADGSRIQGTTVIADGSRIRFGDASVTGRGILTLNRTTFALTGGAEVFGFGTWSGNGTLSLREGSLHGQQTIGSNVKLSVSGRLPKSIVPLRSGDPGEVIVEGEAILDTGPLTIGGKLINRGKITVAADQEPRLTGTKCCAEPVPALVNEGSIRVDRNATLTVEAMRLENREGVDGDGELVLDGGDHLLLDQSSIGLKTTATNGAGVNVLGTVELNATLEQTDGAALFGGADAAFAGRGKWSWQDGDVYEPLQFGSRIEVLIAGAQQKWVQTSTELNLLGPVRFESRGGGVILRNGAKLNTFGTVTLAGGFIGGSNCCSNPAMVNFGGAVTLESGSPASTLGSVAVTFNDTVDLRGGTLEVPDLPAVFVADSGAKLLLDGGTFRAEGGVTFSKGTELAGPGTVVGAVAINGTARLAERGRLLIRGSYVQSGDGELQLTFSGANRDLLAVEGSVTLKGSLAVHGVRTVSATSWPIVTGSGITGGFDFGSGLRPGHELGYSATRVVVRRK